MFDMLYRVPDLHGAGVGAQQMGGFIGATFNIKGVVHGPGRMVLRRIQGGEIEPICLDFRSISDVKAHGPKNGFDSLQCERYRVQTPLPAPATRQRNVQRFGLELHLQLSVDQGLTALLQRGFNRLLDQIDRCPARLLFFNRQGRQGFHQLCDAARLTQK